MEVVDAGRQVYAGQVRSARADAVAAFRCCIWLATLTIQCQLTGAGIVRRSISGFIGLGVMAHRLFGAERLDQSPQLILITPGEPRKPFFLLAGRESGKLSRTVGNWKPAITAVPLPEDATYHDLRHTFASTALAEGVPISDVSRWLGHKSITTTVDLYGHLVSEASGRARDALDKAFARLRMCPQCAPASP